MQPLKKCGPDGAYFDRKWFRGRVARQSSAKASTAVRICSEPRERTQLCAKAAFGGFFVCGGGDASFARDRRSREQSAGGRSPAGLHTEMCFQAPQIGRSPAAPERKRSGPAKPGRTCVGADGNLLGASGCGTNSKDRLKAVFFTECINCSSAQRQPQAA